MGKVLWHVTMSVDGFIAGPDDSMDWAFEQRGSSPWVQEIMDSTGAILAGRRWHDVAMAKYGGRAGIYGGAWDGPVFVLTHEPPQSPPDPAITFVSNGIAQAVSTTLDAAGGRSAGIFGADTARQCLEAGLLDEIVVHLAPVLLGDGVRLYGSTGAGRIDLERVGLAESGQLTDLRFRVLK